MRINLFRKSVLVILFCGYLLSGIFLSGALEDDIAIFGDSQLNYDIQRKVVKAILAFNPSVVFRVGDNVADGANPAQWKLFKDINEPLLKTANYFPALGNHEKGSRLYFDNFPILDNKRWYSVEHEGIHFIVLDSNSDLRPGSDQYNWLLSDLKSIGGDIRFRIAIFHHPIFNVGLHRSDSKKLKPILLPLFQKYGVCAVFSGHDHGYQRFKYEGVYFIVTGGGGAHLYEQYRESPYLQKIEKAYHFCLLSPGNDSLRVRVIGIDSRTIDDFTIPFRPEAGGSESYL
ncbi:MAG: metallophosphoesterase [Candidatus Omnitrophota bacterium]